MHVSRWAELTGACNLRWWGRAPHLAMWSTNLAGDMPKGDWGICVSWGCEHNNKPVVSKSLPSRHRWVIAFIFATVYPLWRLPDQVWVHAFGAVLDSPFALAFAWSPSSLPFPLAHCELQRMRGWAQEHINSPGTVGKKILKAENRFHHRLFNIIRDAYQGRRTALVLWSGPKAFLSMFMAEQLTHLRILLGKMSLISILQPALATKSSTEIQRVNSGLLPAKTSAVTRYLLLCSINTHCGSHGANMAFSGVLNPLTFYLARCQIKQKPLGAVG